MFTAHDVLDSLILFGYIQGNALLPPGSFSLDGLAAVYSRLNKESMDSWRRSDMLGLLMASFALLLRSSPHSLSSPRASGATESIAIDIRKAFRQCLEAPTELKSFSFARIAVIPALRIPFCTSDDDYTNSVAGASCDPSEFLLSVLAEFSSRYLDVLSSCGDNPISRAKWEQDAEDDIRLRRTHLEQQQSFRGQFSAWSGSSPALDLASEGQFEVDPLGRPDCMDDVVAFAISVCSLGPDYASKFWSIETNSQGCSGEENDQVCVKLVPSKALCELKKQQTVDESLQSVYFSFLAVLSLAENPTGARNGNGADAVCEFFTSETDEATNKNHRSWLRVIELLRWYVRQLDPLEYSSSRAASVPSSSTGGSTSYYYFDSEYANDGKVSSDKSMSGERSSQVTPRELGAANEFILLSHLEVISNVTAHLPAARLAILAVNLNVRSADGSEILGQESSLMVLFALASMPLPPEIRGSVFRSIANLISIDGINASEATEFRNVATTGWELLESFGFVPITMLDQYPGQCDPSHQQTTGISFPQSSTSLVSS